MSDAEGGDAGPAGAGAGTTATPSSRRRFLAQGAALAAPPLLALPGCSRPDPDAWRRRVDGRWLGDHADRGHRVRAATGSAATSPSAGTAPGAGALASASAPRATPPPPARTRDADVLVIGGGIAGLAAARALSRAGVQRIAVLELEDSAGGNSRGHAMGGLRCPLGAHYLPLPGPRATVVAEWLVEAGIARAGPDGLLRADERDLCHSPQERLFIDGAWQDGLLPAATRGSRAQAQYRRFSGLVADAARTVGFAIPTPTARWTPAHDALDAIAFAPWLRAQGLDDARLLAYLDYCCRDDYGAGSGTVSAWAGLHYFASRHGFSAPGDDTPERDALLTWPEGNAHLVDRLRAPLGDRVVPGRAVFRVDESRDGVAAWAFAWDGPGKPGESAVVERWTARQAVLATPLFISSRLLAAPPPALPAITPHLRYAPWLVANLRLDRPPAERAGAPLSWDNVVHGSPSLGYVDARHQSLAIPAGDALLTAYWAFPERDRRALLEATWQDATARILADLAVVHPDLPERLQQADLARHGHAMCIPAPGVRGHPALAALRPSAGRTGAAGGRIAFAHADLSAYSVFEEAFTHGDAAGRLAAARLG